MSGLYDLRTAGRAWAVRTVSRHWAMLIVLIPIAFTFYTWVISDGVPYFTDGNETYSAYAHGRNMFLFHPLANSLLTDDAVGLNPTEHPFTYTHQGNLPRYFTYLLFLVGISSIKWQVLIAALLSICLSFWFAYRLFQRSLLPLATVFLLSFLASDFLGVLEWYGNLYRTWHLPLFFGCLLCTRRRSRTLFACIIFFLLFQMEFTFAVFTTLTCLGVLALSFRRPNSLKMAVAICAGASCAILVFLVQLITFLGWKGFQFDLATTYTARNSNDVGWQAIRWFYESHNLVMWPSFATTIHGFGPFITCTNQYGGLMYGDSIWLLASLGILGSVLIQAGRVLAPHWYRKGGPLRPLAVSDSLVAIYLWPMIAGYLILGLTMSGYTLSGYTRRWGPMLGFPIMLALLSMALNIGTAAKLIVRSLPPLTRFATLAGRISATSLAGYFLFLLIFQSVENYKIYPPFMHEPAHLLSTTYAGRSFVSNTTYPHMIACYTQKWAYYSPLLFSPDEDLDQTYNWNAGRSNQEYKRPEYYLCQMVPYRQDVKCKEIAHEMEKRGHVAVAEGATFAIIKLNWRRTPSTP